jgi:hypothetical protein
MFRIFERKREEEREERLIPVFWTGDVTNEEDCEFFDCPSSGELRILSPSLLRLRIRTFSLFFFKSFVITKISSLLMSLRWNCEGKLGDDDSLESLKASFSSLRIRLVFCEIDEEFCVVWCFWFGYGLNLMRIDEFGDNRIRLGFEDDEFVHHVLELFLDFCGVWFVEGRERKCDCVVDDV